MFFTMTASAVSSSSLGLNHTNSVPGSFATGTWPVRLLKASPAAKTSSRSAYRAVILPLMT